MGGSLKKIGVEVLINANEYLSTSVNLSGEEQTSVVPLQVKPVPPIREYGSTFEACLKYRPDSEPSHESTSFLPSLG